MSEPILVDGPFYDDLAVGDRFDSAPRMELTSGLAAAHHAIVGGRLRLAFDPGLSREVTGEVAPLAPPALVWDISIGQSTLVTRRAIANLFYRGLVFSRFPAIGDVLKTTTTIVGLRPVTPKPGRPQRGLVVMRIATSDHDDRPVLDYYRCAMLPARTEDQRGATGETEAPVGSFTVEHLAGATTGWDLAAYRRQISGPHFADLQPGTSWRIVGGDVVSSAPELARLTMNLATIHHDWTTAGTGRRLVYGGHTIGIAAAQLTRALPSLVTILAWHDCDHTGPVHEGDTLHADITLERCDRLDVGGGLAHLRVLVTATNAEGAVSDVLDWRPVGLFA